jgi:hypothetical protein
VGVDSKAGPATHDDESGETDETPADAVRIFVVMAGRPSLKVVPRSGRRLKTLT